VSPDGLARRIRRMRVLAVLGAAAFLVAGYFLIHGQKQHSYKLRVSAGDPNGHRHALALILATEAEKRRLTLEVIPTTGSTEALAQVAAGRLDVALVQGGLEQDDHLCQVAVLIPEPLHIFVRPELVGRGVEALRGQPLNLGPIGSGTRRLALETLARAGLQPADFIDRDDTYSQLREMDPEKLPAAVFHVSSLPAAFAEWIIPERGFGLLPVPFAEAMAIRDRSLHEFVIPAYTYGVDPPMPAQPVPTVASWMSIVAHRDVPDEVIIRLLEAVFDGDFAMRAELPSLDVEQVVRRREFVLHPGTTTFLNRNQPLITGDFIEGVENLRSFIVSILVAMFLGWRWYRNRASVSFERFFDEVTRIEQEILKFREPGGGPASAEQVQQFEQQLSQVKSEAIEQFSSGRLRGDELLGSFLAHVNDVRQCLHASAAGGG
jgi:TRAP transporter TAXI family solute receptor